MNKFIGVGRLTRDPDCGKTKSDISYTRFTIAINRKQKEQGADFINCLAWRGLADVIGKYVKKGHLIGISGELQINQYKAKDGTEKMKPEILVNDIDLLESKKKDDTTQEDDDYKDDLPF